MKKIYIIIVFCFISCSSTIELNKILNNETQFVFFENIENTDKSKVEIIKKDSVFYKYTYSYEFNNNTLFHLIYSDFHSIDDEISKVNKSIIFHIDKSFLRKNKDVIINKKFMDEIGGAKSFEMLLNTRTVFLIDIEELKENKVTVREVKVDWEREE